MVMRPPHLVELYKASLSKKNDETNFIDHSDPWDTMDPMDDNPIDITPLSISDYLVDNGSNDMFSDEIINNN